MVLFVDTIAVVLVLGVIFVGLNLTVRQLNTNERAGSLVASVLFGPQIICNILLLLGLLSSVLVPCIVAVTDVRVFGSLKRFFRYLGQHGRPLLVHFAASFCLGLAICMVILPFLLFAFATVLGTNGPGGFSLASARGSGSTFGLGDEPDHSPFDMGDGREALSDSPFQLPAFGSEESPKRDSRVDSSQGDSGAPWGDGLRWLGIAVVLFVPFCYFCVFWIGSFTRFSQDLENAANTERDIKVSISVD